METLLKKLNDAHVRYVVIDGQAMLQEGMPRFTLDWDTFHSAIRCGQYRQDQYCVAGRA